MPDCLPILARAYRDAAHAAQDRASAAYRVSRSARDAMERRAAAREFAAWTRAASDLAHEARRAQFAMESN